MEAEVLPIEIPVADGTVLRGELRSVGTDWVVLAHDMGDDLDAWADLPGLLAAQGMSALAMDLRGHGASSGVPDAAELVSDLCGVVAFAIAAGAKRLYMAAAGQAAASALELSALPGQAVAGLILISPVLPSPDHRAAPVAKLLLVGSDEAHPDEVAALATGWWVIARIPTTDSGLAMLRGAWAPHAREYISHFLADIRRHSPAAMRPLRTPSPTTEPVQEVKP